MIFGDKNQIAFELPVKSNSSGLLEVSFFLGGKLISSEPVYKPTYTYPLELFLRDISQGKFVNKRFEKLSFEEQFKIITEECETKNSQFFNHLFRIDETIDQYSIFIFQDSSSCRFIWSCWDINRCNSEHQLNATNSVEIPTFALVKVIKEFLLKVN